MPVVPEFGRVSERERKRERESAKRWVWKCDQPKKQWESVSNKTEVNKTKVLAFFLLKEAETRTSPGLRNGPGQSRVKVFCFLTSSVPWLLKPWKWLLPSIFTQALNFILSVGFLTPFFLKQCCASFYWNLILPPAFQSHPLTLISLLFDIVNDTFIFEIYFSFTFFIHFYSACCASSLFHTS